MIRGEEDGTVDNAVEAVATVALLRADNEGSANLVEGEGVRRGDGVEDSSFWVTMLTLLAPVMEELTAGSAWRKSKSPS